MKKINEDTLKVHHLTTDGYFILYAFLLQVLEEQGAKKELIKQISKDFKKFIDVNEMLFQKNGIKHSISSVIASLDENNIWIEFLNEHAKYVRKSDNFTTIFKQTIKKFINDKKILLQ